MVEEKRCGGRTNAQSASVNSRTHSRLDLSLDSGPGLCFGRDPPSFLGPTKAHVHVAFEARRRFGGEKKGQVEASVLL